MVSPALEIFGMEMPRLAKRAARESGLPLMVHIGDTEKRYDPNVIRELLPLLEPGDILTHSSPPIRAACSTPTASWCPRRATLIDGGVWLDTAHGRMNFGFDVGRTRARPGPAAALHQHRPDRARAGATPCTAWSR